MADLPNLTGHNIQDTYQRLVQKGSDGQLYDGTGSATPIKIEGNNIRISGSVIANEYVVSSSVTNITTQTLSGSTSFGDSSDDTHKITGSMDYLGDMTVHGKIKSKGSDVELSEGNITASGDMSASGNIYGTKLKLGDAAATLTDEFHIKNTNSSVDVTLETEGNQNTTIEFKNNQSPDFAIRNQHSGQGFQILSEDKTFILIGSGSNDSTIISGSVETLGPNGHITASGNISSSGGLYGNDLYLKDQAVLNYNEGQDRIVVGNKPTLIQGNLTASGDISSSNIIRADGYNIQNSKFAALRTDPVEGTSMPGVFDIGLNGEGAIYLGSITASKDISASGDITADDIFLPKLGGKIQFAGDPQTYIGTTGAPEQLEIHADSDIRLQPDKDVIIYHAGTEWARFNGDNRSLFLNGKITASGVISGSEYVYGSRLYTDDVLVANNENGILRLGFEDNRDITYGKSGGTHDFYGNITASGNISASGNITSPEGTGSFGYIQLGFTDTSENAAYYPAMMRGDSGLDTLYLTNGFQLNPSEDSLSLNNTIELNGSRGKILSPVISASDGYSASRIVMGDGYIYSGIIMEGINTVHGSISSYRNRLIFGTDHASSQIEGHTFYTTGSDSTLGVRFDSKGSITASGDITASGNIKTVFGHIYGDNFYGRSGLYINNSSSITTSGPDLLVGPTGVFGGHIHGREGAYRMHAFHGHITASGNLIITGSITANSNIKTWGDISITEDSDLNFGYENASIEGWGKIWNHNGIMLYQGYPMGGVSTNSHIFYSGSHVQLQLNQDFTYIGSEVTASGNISASGNIHGTHFIGNGRIYPGYSVSDEHFLDKTAATNPILRAVGGFNVDGHVTSSGLYSSSATGYNYFAGKLIQYVGGATGSWGTAGTQGWHSGHTRQLIMIPPAEFDFSDNTSTRYYGLYARGSGATGEALSTSVNYFAQYVIPKGYKVTGVVVYAEDGDFEVYHQQIGGNSTTTILGNTAVHAFVSNLTEATISGDVTSVTHVIPSAGDYITIMWTPDSAGDKVGGAAIEIESI